MKTTSFASFLPAAAGLLASLLSSSALAQSAKPNAVLVELFTSEGCSSCPPADDLLRKISGRHTQDGQLIVGVGEHVSYWDYLGWKDVYGSELYTKRQSAYVSKFGLDELYTPQIVVNGREQLPGADSRALQAALATEARQKQIELHITNTQVVDGKLHFTYSAAGLPPSGSLQLVAILTDDTDRSNVQRGENEGRQLTHGAVARAFAPLGPLEATESKEVSLPLPALNQGSGHHLVIFAQQAQAGPVVGIDSKGL